MGSLTRRHAELHRGAVAGAAASSVATVVQLALVVGLVSMPTLAALWPSLIASGLAALAYAAIFMVRSVRDGSDSNQPGGRPFDPKTALLFVLVVGVTLLLSALLTQWLGDRGLLIASAVSGFSDAHASAISAASLAAGGTVGMRLAAVAVLIGFTTNAISKAVVAFSLGDRRYAFELLPGLLLMVAGAWVGWVLFGSRMVNG
jgi:uncharacterized membrane protein (DUF4010 family)